MHWSLIKRDMPTFVFFLIAKNVGISPVSGHILEALNVIQKHDPCQKNER